MECQEAKLKVQALVDNELREDEIDEVVDHVQSCYRCRDDYKELLKLQRKLQGVTQPEPSTEWFDTLNRKVGRRVGTLAGQILFIGSYVVLFAYAMVSFFRQESAGLFIKVVVGCTLGGLLLLLGVTIYDRMKESKTDKYKGVMR